MHRTMVLCATDEFRDTVLAARTQLRPGLTGAQLKTKQMPGAQRHRAIFVRGSLV
jgi:hypothetical protein